MSDWVVIDALPARTPDDFARIEAAIASHTGGEGGRCQLFLSQAYQRLRLGALYPDIPEPITSLYHHGLLIAVRDGFVTLAREDPGGPELLMSLEELAATPSNNKRPRLI